MTLALCFVPGLPSGALITTVRGTVCVGFLCIPLCLQRGPRGWMANIHPGHLPSILQSTGQPKPTHSGLAPMLVKGCFLQGPRDGSEQGAHADPGQVSMASCPQTPAKPSWASSFFLSSLCDNRSELAAWGSTPFLSGPKQGIILQARRLAPLMTIIIICIYTRSFIEGILKCITNNN